MAMCPRRGPIPSTFEGGSRVVFCYDGNRSMLRNLHLTTYEILGSTYYYRQRRVMTAMIFFYILCLRLVPVALRAADDDDDDHDVASP